MRGGHHRVRHATVGWPGYGDGCAGAIVQGRSACEGDNPDRDRARRAGRPSRVGGVSSMARALWTGSISFGLATIPVGLHRPWRAEKSCPSIFSTRRTRVGSSTSASASARTSKCRGTRPARLARRGRPPARAAGGAQRRDARDLRDVPGHPQLHGAGARAAARGGGGVPQRRVRVHDRGDRPARRLHQQVPRRRVHGRVRRPARRSRRRPSRRRGRAATSSPRSRRAGSWTVRGLSGSASGSTPARRWSAMWARRGARSSP